jgi:pyruvate/2-oxoglutarate dehydrogenase complex dihydrolipoamide dehydrogenase (E3) component
VADSELIPPEEFEAAVKLVVRQQFGIKFDAVIESVARLFGFGRTGVKLKAAIEQALIRLDRRGEIKMDDASFVTVPQ